MQNISERKPIQLFLDKIQHKIMGWGVDEGSKTPNLPCHWDGTPDDNATVLKKHKLLRAGSGNAVSFLASVKMLY